MYLLDSCVCIDFLRGKLPHAYDLMRKSDPRLFKIPAIVEAELRCGLEKSSKKEENRWLLDEFMLPFEVVDFDSGCAHEYAILRAQLETQGMTIGANDLLIAATALANHATLVTNNVREFKRIGNLRVESRHEIPLP